MDWEGADWGRMGRLTGHKELRVGMVVDVELETGGRSGEFVDVGGEDFVFWGIALACSCGEEIQLVWGFLEIRNSVTSKNTKAT